MPIRCTWPVALAACALALGTVGAHAQADGFPSKPIRIIVPYSPGGAGEQTARVIGEHLTAQWKQPVVVDFKPGASNIVGLQALSVAPKDGHTLMLCATNISTNPHLYKSLPYKSQDITGVSLAVRMPYVVVATTEMPATNAKEFVSHVRAHPGKINYATLGSGSPANFLAQAFARDNGLDMAGIAYKGSAQILPDLIAGRVHVYLDSPAVSVSMHRQGRLRVLGVAADARLPSAPELPTMKEQGFDFSYESWFGICAPSGVPAAVLDKLGQGVRAAIASEDFQTRISRSGAIPESSASPAAFSAFIKDQVDAWGAIIRPLNVQLD